MLYINSKVSFIEDLKFSKAHNIWASDREFDRLHQFAIGNDKKPTPASVTPVPQANTVPKTGVHSGTGPRTERKQEYTNNQRDPYQTVYRKKVADLVKKFPHVLFYNSLYHWNNNYTPKQAAAIRRSWDDEFKDKPEPEPDIELNEDGEEDDPNYRPWND